MIKNFQDLTAISSSSGVVSPARQSGTGSLPNGRTNDMSSAVIRNDTADPSAVSQVASFYDGKTVFITGGTGFMGKVLLEKLLRCCPGVSQIYLLIRPKRGQDAQERLRQLLCSPLFDPLRKERPNDLSKLMPIEGDITQPDLAISVMNRMLLQRTVNVVFHSAATVKFDEKLKLSVTINMLGTQRLVELCKGMTGLQALIHVSTAYCNCDRPEVEEMVYPPPIGPDQIVSLVGALDEELVDEFPEEQEKGKSMPMGLISSTWLYELNGVVLCWWPQYIISEATRSRTVRSHSKIDTDKCVSCSVLVKYSTKDYEVALSKMRQLEVHSEIEESDSEQIGRRQIHFPSRSNDDFYYNSLSDLECANEPEAPRLKPNKIKSQYSKQPTPSDMGTRIISKNKAETSNLIKQPQSIHSLTPVPYPEGTFEKEQNSKDKVDEPMKCCCEKNIVILSNICKELKQIKDTLNTLSISCLNATTDVVVEINQSTTFDDLKKLDNDLLLDKELRTKMYKRLALIGGKDAHELTRNIMGALIVHDLALKMTYSGKGKTIQAKDGLQSCPEVIKMIFAAVRANPLGEGCTDREIQTYIMNWFRHAADRQGGRLRRTQKS